MAQEDLSQLKIDKSTATARPARRNTRRFWVAGALAVAVLAVLFFSGILKPAREVQVVTVQQTYPSQVITLLNASGYVVAQRKAAVASKATGRLIWLGVEEGSRVKKGDILARLESEDVAASEKQAAENLKNSRTALDQANAELHDAQLSYSRQKLLLSQGVVAEADYDAAQARYRKAKAAVAGARAGIGAAAAALEAASVAVEFTMIRAPFDAVVLTKNADVGDIVTPFAAAANAKAAVVTLADMGSLQVEVDVSESSIEQVRPGQPCEIQLDALPDTRFRGTVHMIVPTADRSKATVLVKVRFDEIDRRILPEMSAKVAFLSRPLGNGERKPRITVASAAVAERHGRKVVFVVKDDRVVETPVALGEKLGEAVEIVRGVKVGDRVVQSPDNGLKDGSRIKLLEK
ncbi:MAG: efflux RND transporter periplasmic adaptor subunit [Geobacteraceae bacterium]|nr:efflux RND transporter periplasmic adaptor subunit [Geobacteraceae bacterium]